MRHAENCTVYGFIYLNSSGKEDKMSWPWHKNIGIDKSSYKIIGHSYSYSALKRELKDLWNDNYNQISSSVKGTVGDKKDASDSTE